MPGSTVLVLGPGAGGGEVLGALAKGCNVVAMEKNPYQFTNLHGNLLMVKQNIAKKDAEDKDVAEKEKDREWALNPSVLVINMSLVVVVTVVGHL